MVGFSELVTDKILVSRVAAISDQSGEQKYFGHALPLAKLPRAATRRMGHFEKCIIACVMGLDQSDANIPIVMGSRYGTVASNTLHLLKGLSENDLLSPTRFSLSVHNAAIGLTSQLTGNTAGHTAVAAGADTLKAIYTEALTRLKLGCEQVIIVYGDCPLVDDYSEFDEIGRNYFLAALVQLDTAADDADCELGHLIKSGNVQACFDYIEAGVEDVTA